LTKVARLVRQRTLYIEHLCTEAVIKQKQQFAEMRLPKPANGIKQNNRNTPLYPNGSYAGVCSVDGF